MIALIKKKVSLGMIIFCGISYQNQSFSSSINEGAGNDSDKEEFFNQMVYTPACKKASEKHDLNNHQIIEKCKRFTKDESLKGDEELLGKKLYYSSVKKSITKNAIETNNVLFNLEKDIPDLEEYVIDSNFDLTQQNSNK